MLKKWQKYDFNNYEDRSFLRFLSPILFKFLTVRNKMECLIYISFSHLPRLFAFWDPRQSVRRPRDLSGHFSSGSILRPCGWRGRSYRSLVASFPVSRTRDPSGERQPARESSTEARRFSCLGIFCTRASTDTSEATQFLPIYVYGPLPAIRDSLPDLLRYPWSRASSADPMRRFSLFFFCRFSFNFYK